MSPFRTAALPEEPDYFAPDGSAVRLLMGCDAASLAHFEMRPGQVTAAVRHRSVRELWYVVAGSGRIWRGAGIESAITDLAPGTCVEIEPGVSFQVAAGTELPLRVVCVTLPPWPGPDEAQPADGPWAATERGAASGG